MPFEDFFLPEVFLLLCGLWEEVFLPLCVLREDDLPLLPEEARLPSAVLPFPVPAVLLFPVPFLLLFPVPEAVLFLLPAELLFFLPAVFREPEDFPARSVLGRSVSSRNGSRPSEEGSSVRAEEFRI